MGLGLPEMFTVEFVKKFVPVTSRLKVGPAAFTLLGVSEVMVGAAGLIVKVFGNPLTPPPGPGFETSTGTWPSVFTRTAGTVAVRLPEDTELAATKWPLNDNVAPFTNPEPVAVIVTAAFALPTVGVIKDSEGGPPITTNVSCFEVVGV